MARYDLSTVVHVCDDIPATRAALPGEVKISGHGRTQGDESIGMSCQSQPRLITDILASTVDIAVIVHALWLLHDQISAKR